MLMLQLLPLASRGVLGLDRTAVLSQLDPFIDKNQRDRLKTLCQQPVQSAVSADAQQHIPCLKIKTEGNNLC
jgi:hypothetical protein